ncbi:MAG: type II toxin-antitoxin system HipA family toxin [Gammaproteobacteria bacterium]|nr:type II toxin-antitoxin system HipA family toxin [Gammaproteobacteria bacterium]
MPTDARVRLWGRDIGAVSWLTERNLGVFQYTAEFARSHIEICPLTMPLREFPYEFPALPGITFKGLPGMLADCLPDKWGNALIDTWLAAQGRTPDSFNPVKRLCYIGRRGMGALEFEPAHSAAAGDWQALDIAALVDLSSRVLNARAKLEGVLGTTDDHVALENILKVGTSAGGARAKAILAWNPLTGEFRSGQLPAAEGFEYWLLKFDGVSGNGDHELSDPAGFGRIEYAYALMALAAGISMSPCRLHEEGGRAHFMTRRFDRTADGQKLHMLSLCAMAHFDFNLAGAYSYEQAIQVIRQLGLGMDTVEEQVRRAFFNVLARNQDDHVKNIAFLMDMTGTWSLSPAFDISYAWNPGGAWTGQHQMSLAGKRDGFTTEDLLGFGENVGLKKVRVKRVLSEVSAAVSRWAEFAHVAGVTKERSRQIEQAFRKF